mgnify:CR=1 FL=1
MCKFCLGNVHRAFRRSHHFVGNAACSVSFSGVLIVNFGEGVRPLPYFMITIITWERSYDAGIAASSTPPVPAKVTNCDIVADCGHDMDLCNPGFVVPPITPYESSQRLELL